MILEVALPLNINRNFDYLSDFEVKTGCRIIVPFNNRKITGFVVAIKKKSDLHLKKIYKVIDSEPIITDDIISLAYWISKYYLCPLGSALNLILPKNVRISKKVTGHLNKHIKTISLVTLTDEQKNATERIVDSIKNRRQANFLLYGINDSGKTEIYIKAIEQCINQGGSAIYLVPDVSLTNQFEELLYDRFGDKLGLWHSNLSQRDKSIFFAKLKLGIIKVVLGTRSAIFLPVRNPNLFILDEEDDEFYKNIQAPRYHARDIAIKRAEIVNGVVVFGSATPSIETYNKVKHKTIEILKLSERIERRPLPKVTVINLKYTKRFAISKPLQFAIQSAILNKKQIFLFINRRGWATSVKCSNCEQVIKCPKCLIPLIAHKNQSVLLCHYCGYKQTFIKNCPDCNGSIIYSGYGTEKVEEIVRKLFPNTKIIRMDSDTKDTHLKIFQTMKSGYPCILIGTQIAAKGFDFSNITLVGVINANSGLYSADFRAAERTFSILTHSIGRCGRGSSESQVIIQADEPEHYAIKHAAEYDYEKFFNHELEFRKEFLWPPYKKLINITILGKKEKDIIIESESIVSYLKDEKDLVILGPVPKIVPFLAGKHRWQILLKVNENDFNEIALKLMRIMEAYPKKGVNMVLDVDPIETV
ncbi:MAG TPA: primosomal protein N' [Elusimicrobia bacterium]|nr:MAG: primosomal protein N' [Elusimicrobia bacterium RIFOXYD2_FULL_34_30]HAM39679.1 primosomal protein N' [Elusimicrobiota bacterium]